MKELTNFGFDSGVMDREASSSFACFISFNTEAASFFAWLISSIASSFFALNVLATNCDKLGRTNSDKLGSDKLGRTKLRY